MRTPWNRRRHQLVSDDALALADRADQLVQRAVEVKRETRGLANKSKYVKSVNGFGHALAHAMEGLTR